MRKVWLVLGIGAALLTLTAAFVLWKPSINCAIVGPHHAAVGSTPVYFCNGAGVAAGKVTWTVSPDMDLTTHESGRVLIAHPSAAGEYVLAAAVVSAADSPKVLLFRLTVSGPDPEPGPDPDPDPEPGPEPGPDPSGAWADWADKAARELVPAAKRPEQAAAVAAVMRTLAAKIAAGGVESPAAARQELRLNVNRALGHDASAWVPFSSRFAARCQELAETGRLTELSQYQTIYSGVADGLDRVAGAAAISQALPPTVPAIRGRLRGACLGGSCR